MLPLPIVLQQRYFANVTVASEGGDVGGLYDPGVTTDTPEAVQKLAGLVFWAAAAFSLLLVLHLPVVAFVARRIAAGSTASTCAASARCARASRATPAGAAAVATARRCCAVPR